MKINQQDYNDLKNAIVGVVGNRKVSDIWANYQANGLSELRFRWDLVWHIQNIVRQPIFDRIYKYAHDSHVDTALRRIVKEISEQ
ncbi:MAG TPA: hypothetical protein VMP68_08175 [Candidatus Eisenbacteria bacterium]|nr:hypothetical protein [Candidatus Eisenbacteria bacterium]